MFEFCFCICNGCFFSAKPISIYSLPINSAFSAYFSEQVRSQYEQQSMHLVSWLNSKWYFRCTSLTKNVPHSLQCTSWGVFSCSCSLSSEDMTLIRENPIPHSRNFFASSMICLMCHYYVLAVVYNFQTSFWFCFSVTTDLLLASWY